MTFRELGHSTLRVSTLGIGGLHFGTYVDQSTTKVIIHHAIDLGANFIDTAPMYGNGFSEEFIGRTLGSKRKKVILSTKVGLQPSEKMSNSFHVVGVPLTRSNIRQHIHASLSKLQTDYIDLCQLHLFDPITPIEETREALHELIQEGKVRYVGCSNFSPEEMETSDDIADSNGWERNTAFQVRYNIIERMVEAQVFALCQRRGVNLICNNALSRGILSGQYTWNESFPKGSRAQKSKRVRQSLSEVKLYVVRELMKFARGRKRSLPELAIAWLLSKPEVSIVLVGMRDTDQVAMNCRATDWILTDLEKIEIDQIIEKKGYMSNVRAEPAKYFEV